VPHGLVAVVAGFLIAGVGLSITFGRRVSE
jgi:hypothetical protein